jgi:hypothetical protein
MISIRIKALQTYLQRVLRPIWDTRITYRQTEASASKQISNVDTFLPALNKLRNFLRMLEKNQNMLSQSTTGA